MISSRNGYLSIVFLLTFVALSDAAMAQQLKQRKPARVPIYKSSNDSIRIAEIDQEIEQAYLKTSTPQYIIDTLTAKRDRAVKEGVVRYRNVYYANTEMTHFDSLALISDRNTVKAVTIEKRKLKRVPKILRKFPNLAAIELVNCQISKIDRSARRLRSLHTLIILNNGAERALRLTKISPSLR